MLGEIEGKAEEFLTEEVPNIEEAIEGAVNLGTTNF